MDSPSPSRTDQWFTLVVCFFLGAYSLHGFVGGAFYLPARRGPMPTVEGAFILAPLMACWLVAASLLVRVHILMPQLRKYRTTVELLLLASGVCFWLFAFYLSACGRSSP